MTVDGARIAYRLTRPGAEPLEHRLAHWFARTERHARQLHELDWAEYRANKLREFAQSADLQKRIDARSGE